MTMKSFILIIASILTFMFPAIPVSGSNGSRAVRLFSDPELITGLYTCFCLDKDGMLWIGSDTGLLRFDGNSYDVYRHDDNNPGSISDNRILKILCDSHGNLWVGTANGLNRYNPDTDTFSLITLPEKAFDGYIIGLTEQHDGTITFLVSGVGLYVIDHSDDMPVAVRYLPNTIGEKGFSILTQSPDKSLYLGCHNGSLCIISPNGNAELRKISSDYITGIVVENDSSILISAVNDIYRYDPQTDRLTALTIDSRSKLPVNNITCGKDGTVYVATQGSGLWKIRPGSNKVEKDLSLYSPLHNINHLKIGATYIDPNDNLWIGCNFYGVGMVPSTPIPFFYRGIRDIVSTFSGGLNTLAFVGSKLLVAISNGTILILNPDGSLSAKAIVPTGNDATSIIEGSDGSALVGVANDGIYRLELSTGKMSLMLPVEGKFPGIHLCMATDGDIFAGVHGIGLLRYNPSDKSVKWYYNEEYLDRLTNNYIASLHRSADNKIWIGLYGGLACYDCKGDSLMKIDQRDFLKRTTSSFEDGPDGSVYMATTLGLIHYHPDKGVIRTYSTEDGLSNHEIRSLTTDLNGNLWLGTMHGLSCMRHGSDKIISYHGGYGLYEKRYPYAVTSPLDGTVYFGNDAGITSLRPSSVTTPDLNNCNIKVSALYVNGSRVFASSMSGDRPIIDGNPLSPSALHLSHKDNTLMMRLSTLDFRDASNVRYKWQIPQLGDTWTRTKPGENTITLPTLEPGDYTLRLKACENNISSDVTEIRIHIASPWYTSDIAKVLYLLVLIAIIVLSFTVMKKKREEKINDAKIKFFMDISHDIRSPVTLILSPLESLLKQPLDPEVTAKLHTMRRNAHRLLSLVNQLLDLRKIEKGKMRLKCSPTDMRSFVGELVEMYESQAETKHISMEFKCDDELPKVSIDRDNFDKILVNLISNAIKYTPDGGNIQVRLCKADDDEIGKCAEIQVIDSGIGLDNKTLAHIFDRFYRARENHGNSASVGFGIGLDLCRRLVTLHGGTISAANRSDGTKGSVFTVRIPLYEQDTIDNQAITIGEGNSHAQADNDNKHIAGSYIPNRDTPPASTRGKVRYSASNRRILVEDDDAELREYIKDHLSGVYRVTTASNGAEAMKMILDNVPDLVVSDVMMPEMDGLTLLKQLKSNSRTHHVPVILLSSKSDIADRMAGWNRGADGYIGKPFDIDELDMMIDNIIDNRLKLKGKFSGVQDNDDKIATPEMKGNDEALMEKIMAIINTHINDPMLNVEKLGREVGISRAHLHRKMKELIGMTPSDFIRNIRLRRACELLKKPDVDITQVAYTLGFTSQPHFSTAFKRFTGVSPTEYRTMHVQGKSPEIPELPEIPDMPS